MKLANSRFVFGSAMLLATMMSTQVHAEEHIGTVNNAKWQTECGACHVAYPPQLLDQASWRAVMSGLDKHFGSDASLDPASAREIGAFLDKHAGTRSSAGLLRITETRWFKREHDEVSQRTWSNPKVKSPANCAACHTQAERGNFSERNIHIPR